MNKKPQRQRKHRKGASHGDGKNNAPAQNSNIAELLPLSKSEKEEKRRKLEAELLSQQPKVSKEKQKRLKKYIVGVPFLDLTNLN